MKYAYMQHTIDLLRSQAGDHPYVGDYSVTELLMTPRHLQLRRRHASDLDPPLDGAVLALFGTAVHKVLREKLNVLSEMELSVKVADRIISGRLDCYDPETKTLIDYKVTTTAALQTGRSYDKWTQQLNLYAFFLELHEHPVSQIMVEAFIRDWNYSYLRMPSKPQAPLVPIAIPKWPENEARQYLVDRVKMHVDAERLSDDSLPPCPSDYMWERDGMYTLVVIGKRNKRTKIAESKERLEIEQAAKRYLDEWLPRGNEEPRPRLDVLYKPGQRLRCEHWCEVRGFCRYAIEYAEHVKAWESKTIKEVQSYDEFVSTSSDDDRADNSLE